MNRPKEGVFMKFKFLRIQIQLIIISALCFALGFYLYTPARAYADQTLTYDADGVNITVSQTDINGVTGNGDFTYAYDSFTTDTATNMATWTGSWGTDKISYWNQPAFSAVTLQFAEVDVSDYDTVEIRYFGNNWETSSMQYVYVFSGSATSYESSNAVCSYLVQKESHADLTIQIDSSSLADANGKISSVTIARGASLDTETVGGKGWIDYISFYNSRSQTDTAIYTELYVEEMHQYTGAVYAYSDGGSNYVEIRNTVDGPIYDQSIVSEVVGISNDNLKLTFKDAGGQELSADLVAYDLYLSLSDEHRGFGDENGWEELKNSSQICEYITVNGIKLKNISSEYKVNAGGPRTLYFRFNYGIFDAIVGDALVLEIPNGTRASKNYQGEGFEFVAKTVCTLDKETLDWQVVTDPVNWGTPVLGEKELTDCSHAGLTVYTGKDYEEKANYDFSSCEEGTVIDKNGRNWHTNSQTELLAGSGYTKIAPKGDGTNDVITGNFYKMCWGVGVDYPSMIVEFPYQTAQYDRSDYLVVKLYVSSKITAQSIWFTNIDTAHVDNGEKVDLPEDRDQWTEVKVKASKFLNADGTAINAIGITFFYGIGVQSQVVDNEVYFDSFFFRTVVRDVKSNYEVNDLSEIVPVATSGYTFTGEWTAGEINPDNYSQYVDSKANVAFLRFDCSATAIKMKVKAVFGAKYNFYFTLNAPDFHYDKGGVNYWFSNEGISIGGRSNKANSFAWEDLPQNLRIKSGVEFTLEIGAVPYMVDGVRSGYYGYIKINDVDVLDASTIEYKEKAYVDEGDVGGANGFGSYFGLYLHDSTNGTSVTVYPQTMTDECPLIVSLKTRNNVDKLEIGETIKLLTSTSMDLYGGKEESITVINDSGAYLQGRNTLVADRNGKFKANYTYTCCFGSFQSNTLEITVGTGISGVVWIIVGVSAVVMLAVVTVVTVILVKKKKVK